MKNAVNIQITVNKHILKEKHIETEFDLSLLQYHKEYTIALGKQTNLNNTSSLYITMLLTVSNTRNIKEIQMYKITCFVKLERKSMHKTKANQHHH